MSWGGGNQKGTSAPERPLIVFRQKFRLKNQILPGGEGEQRFSEEVKEQEKDRRTDLKTWPAMEDLLS